MLQRAPTDQNAITGHPFRYDLSLGGTAVTDPDNDRLTYEVTVLSFGPRGHELPLGMTLSGPVISGAPEEAGNWEIQTAVDDGRGGTTVVYRIWLRVAANRAPVVVRPNSPVLVSQGAAFDYDATQAGTVFVDPDGDPVTYEVSLRGFTTGLAVSGARITGSFPTAGAAEATLVARDAYGGAEQHAFLIAAPAPEGGTPSLPEPGLVYRDEDLPLPAIFRISSESVTPLWDTQPDDNRTTNAGAALGRVLFYDRRLSITNTVSCSSCHQQGHGFASPERFDAGVLGIPLKRNSMALANVRYSIAEAWFWDMRVQSPADLRGLQAVVLHPLEDRQELGMTPELLVPKLAQTPFYPALFNAAFGTPEVTIDRVRRALAQFAQALISYRSRHDLANNPMENVPATPEAVFNAAEMRGLDIYVMSCAVCHRLAANTNEWQANNGLDEVPSDPGTTNPAFQRDGSVGVFRAPSLRNIALSAPYMHDGRFTTLRQVIEHYDNGVKFSRNLDGILRRGDAPLRLNLSEQDKDALEAFLNTLTDEAFLADPRFSNPF